MTGNNRALYKGLMPIQNYNALRFITTLRYDSNLLKAINNMTFLFDANWQGLGNTLPIAFFFVTDITEVMESEVSQKNLLFYNSQSSDNKDATSGSLLNVVSDNIVPKPKKYEMKILVPASTETYFEQYQFMPMPFNVDSNAVTDVIGGTINTMNTFIWNLVKVLGVDDIHITKGLISDLLLDNTRQINKDSIEAMWENRGIIKMKMWNGWEFKYIAIESFRPSKKGEDGDFFEATLTVTEVPIMTFRKESNVVTPKTSLLGGAVKTFINSIKDSIDMLSEKGDE